MSHWLIMTKAEAEDVLKFMIFSRERFLHMAERITAALELNTFETDVLAIMLSGYGSAYTSLRDALKNPDTIWADVFSRWDEPTRKRKHCEAFASRTPSAAGMALPA